MSLQDALRRAVSLVVEMPPDASPQDRDELLDEVLANAATRTGPASSGASAGGAPSTAMQTKTVEQIVRDADGPDLDQIKVGGAATPGNAAPANVGTVLDAPAIYAAAKLPAAPFSAEQMLDMLASLPQELPLDTRRQTVKVTLSALGKTMGASPETIVADASRKMAALASYVDHLTKRTQEFAQSSEKEIEALQSQIEAKRKALQDAKHQLAQSTDKCRAEVDRLDDVLEFFSLDVPPSKYAAASPLSAPAANSGSTPTLTPTTQSAPGLQPVPLSSANRADASLPPHGAPNKDTPR